MFCTCVLPALVCLVLEPEYRLWFYSVLQAQSPIYSQFITVHVMNVVDVTIVRCTWIKLNNIQQKPTIT